MSINDQRAFGHDCAHEDIRAQVEPCVTIEDARRRIASMYAGDDVSAEDIEACAQGYLAEWASALPAKGVAFAQWLRDRADAVVNDDPAAASTLYLAAEQAPAGIVAPTWGPLPTAAEVTAHVAHCAPARPHSGAPWARKHGDSSGDGVSIVYLRADAERLWWRTPTGGIWYVFNDRDARGQWRPVDGDGMPVERGER